MDNEKSSLVKVEFVDKFKAALIFVLCTFVSIALASAYFYLVKKISFASEEYFLYCLAVFFIFTCQFLYVVFSRNNLVASTKQLFAIEVSLVLAFGVCLYLSSFSLLAVPLALAAFLIAPISRRRDAFIGNLMANILLFITLLFQNAVSPFVKPLFLVLIFTVGVVSGTMTAYTIAISTKRLHYIVKGFFIGLFSHGVLFLFSYLKDFGHDSAYVNLGMASIGVFASIVLGLILQPCLEKIFNLITNSRLVELTDHNSPLIKRLINEAPGTFNHSLAVANFAEICASAIGVNPYLARACAYYHDIGKLASPLFFKENQAGFNPHDEILPEVSADIIRAHTTEGAKLCKKYRIPDEVASITVQHHGTLSIAVFLNKAKKLTDSDIDDIAYRYHGVTPRTKVAAIIMLCDTAEAAIRAMDDPNGEKIDKLLRNLSEQRLKEGQFDHCDITMEEINTIRETIINAFGGLYHKRLKYPGGKE